MTIEVRRQQGESPQTLIRRFSQRIKLSGVLVRARRKRFKIRPKSKQMRKKAAIRREELKNEYEKLRRLGKWH